MKDINLNIVLGFVILVGAYLMFKRLGLIRSKVVKALDRKVDENIIALTENQHIFDPDTYKKREQSYAYNVPDSTAQNWADTIKKAWGFFNDDEATIYNVFREITSQIQISQIADKYADTYQKDLLHDINSKMNNKERSYLWEIIKTKPFTV